MGRRNKLAATLEEAAHDKTVRAMAASAAVAAGGAIAATKVARDRVVKRRLKRARRYRLGSDETARKAIRRIARGQLGYSIAVLSGDEGPGGAEAIHEVRKSLKRLRTLLRLNRDLLGDQRYRSENLTLRDLGRSLSAARDAQVLLDTLSDLRTQEDTPPEVWSHFRSVLEAEIQSGSSGPNGAVGEDPAQTLEAARLRVSTWPFPDRGGVRVLAPGFERIYRRGRRAMRAAQSDASVENLHELRKRAKDLWYAAQLLRAAAPKRMKKLARRAHRLSDLLGDDHDLAILAERAHASPELFESSELELLNALIETRRDQLRHKALREATQLYGRKPRKQMRRLALA
jgi:CHAD domain-containing protein